MILKQTIWLIAMALFAAAVAVLDSTARAGPRSGFSIQRQWPMGSDQAAIIRDYQQTVPTQSVLVVHRHTTWLHQGAKGMRKSARGRAR